MSKVKTIKRDTNGLLSGVDYIFNEDGLIDWRKMIKSEYLVPNKDKTNETDVTKLKDYQLIILLGGIKELAQIRGFTSVTYDLVSPSSDYVAATCKISWKPNFETEGEEVVFSAIGDASPNNTSGFGQAFLAACAENRAFVRCVRNFLRINIVSQEELAGNNTNKNNVVSSVSAPEKSDPHQLLSTAMKEKGIPFKVLKKKLEDEGFKGASELDDVSGISKSKVFELIERIKKAK
tara:strand:- start:621 stop:1325 length:705 start_codon:yes stop_codon:yes gene_type:complete